jgi:hypothetical protein
MKRLFFVSLLIVVLLPVSGLSAQDGEMPSLDELDEGWNTLTPGGDTVCSLGTPYLFHVRPGANDKLLLFFNGGGACWSGEACDVEVEPNIHTPVAEVANDPRENGGTGIFNLENEENPFADYTMVFLPYCTGDVFVGAGETTYTYEVDGEEKEITIYHNGYVNTTTVLDWVYTNVDSPATVVVAGSSAGALGSAFYTGPVAEHYSDASVVHIGDGAGGYRNPGSVAPVTAWDVASILPDWEEYADETNETITFQDFYVANELRFPNVTIAQYNTAADEVQVFFNGLLGETENTLAEKQFLNYNDIRTAVNGEFYTYTAGGTVHTILRLPQFYEYEVEGVRFVDWVNDLINGETVENVSCDYFAGECQTAPGE